MRSIMEIWKYAWAISAVGVESDAPWSKYVSLAGSGDQGMM